MKLKVRRTLQKPVYPAPIDIRLGAGHLSLLIIVSWQRKIKQL